MPESVERRRERARVAQRRSRAQRKATLETLQARVQVLTKALEDMTEHCLGFSDVVISAVRKDNFDFLRHNAQPFMKKILSIASTVLDEDSDEEGADRTGDIDNGENMKESTSQRYGIATPPDEQVQDLTAADATTPTQLDFLPQQSISPQHDLVTAEVASRRPVSPCLGYGMWPSMTTLQLDEDMPPLDLAKYTDIQGVEVSFSTALFWNSISLAHAVLLEPSTDLVKKFFCYAMRSEPLDLILSRIHRRIAFKPAQMSMYMVDEIQSRQEQITHDLSSVLRDPSTIGGTIYEANMMDQHHRMIVDNMNHENDDIQSYIDAAGVEKRLASYWGMSSVSSLSPAPAWVTQPGKGNSDFPTPPSTPWYHSFISQLSLSSRCIGNGIGFPINVVDDLALQLRNASIVA
ncbi:hypothetical protein M409DRAFT_17983 [Zasmidium cellare ATCC 36951]|uniref:BZIP domain-containing protein n=1 Tax=Zasmidium cellare ATCC 36951 TaxID=1080233 RepID=A0A6A6D000_ZASCE|nr:uncharacterized protein M409DRAFT_17983 [Zasmidium cellare ATCC 36951]KAF2171748.1 hypothetical protein M409DRAFT_17983 [Zasmidium cellare ATCC 36951]